MITKILNSINHHKNICPNSNDEIILLIGHQNYPISVIKNSETKKELIKTNKKLKALVELSKLN